MDNKLKKQLDLKRTDIRRMKRTGNFTLLELLIVVAILAVIAGGMVSSFTNVEENATQAQAARDIAALDQAVQIYSSFESGIPDNVDSLLSNVVTLTSTDASVTGDLIVTDPTELGAFDDAAALFDGSDTIAANAGIKKKIAPQLITSVQLQNLLDAGLTKVRYIDSLLDVNGVIATSAIPAFNGTAAITDYGPLDSQSIPQNYFNAPRPGSERNRGRGFVVNVTAASLAITAANVQFAIWGGQNPTTPINSYDNVKVGANADAVLVAFGLGPDCSLVGKDAKFGLSSGTPYYSNVAKNEYNNYIMLVDVTKRPAKVVAIVDSKGDFRGEEVAEYLDQKL